MSYVIRVEAEKLRKLLDGSEHRILLSEGREDNPPLDGREDLVLTLFNEEEESNDADTNPSS